MGIKKVNPIPILDIERRCSMLFPILQAIWQQFGPQAIQILNSPALLEILRKIPPTVLLQGGRVVSESVSKELQSLTPEQKQQLQDVAVWIAKDMAGDVAAAATGLPISPVVDKVVEMVLDN
jgi:hypothetical protein